MPSELHPVSFVHFHGLLYQPLSDIWVCPCGVLYKEGDALNSLGASSGVLKLNPPVTLIWEGASLMPIWKICMQCT